MQYYRGLVHHIRENKTDITDRCEFYEEALVKVSKVIMDKGWIASDCEFSILSDNDGDLKPYRPVVAVSGGFDPIHVGHVRMIQDASKIGKVVVILNTDQFLLNKKGYVFMSFEERKEILEAIRGVEWVYKCIDEDDTVIKTLKWLKPDYFVNGGDINDDNNKEKKVCEDMGCRLLYNVGGGKIQSSSKLVNNIKGR